MGQAFQGLAPDMAMSNLHNELENRRQTERGSTEPTGYDALQYDEVAESLVSFLVLSWMVENQENDFPPDAFMAVFIDQATSSMDQAEELKNRNIRRQFIGLLDDEFRTLHAQWNATLSDPAAEQGLSDRVWRDYLAQYDVDLRAMSLDDYLRK